MVTATTYEELEKIFSKYIRKPESKALIRKAWDVAESLHSGQL